MINLFAHRGFWSEKSNQNSIFSLNNAHENKFSGIEFDIWFCDQKLVISHDDPGNCNDLLQFGKYLKYANDFKYWLDFKNLTLKNAEKSFLIAKNDINKANIDIKNIYLAPYFTNYQITSQFCQIAREVFGSQVQFAALFDKKDQEDDLVKLIKAEKIQYLSVLDSLIDEDFIRKIPQVEIFAWTINDLKKLLALKNLGIKNFITDSITPQIYERKTKNNKPT